LNTFVSHPGGALTCVFWDVQHGNATYVGTPDGEHVAIDAGWGSVGTGGERFSPLKWLIDQWGVHRLDAAIVTHPHFDHVADLDNLRRLQPGILARPRLDKQAVVEASVQGRPIVAEYEDWEATYNAPVTGANPISCNRANGYRAELFEPTRCPESNLNNRSLVTVLSYAGTRFLIPGDNEAASWQELLERDDFVEAISGTDILLAAHHGREAGFCEELFEVISPRLTVISDGPTGGTSVTEKYARYTRGMTCDRRGGAAQERRVVTTRKDGAVSVHCWHEGTQAYIRVGIN
jgi:beta-lactamase superfamily II metal-dependent hydrolase